MSGDDPAVLYTRAWALLETAPAHFQDLLRPVIVHATQDRRLEPFLELLLTDAYYAHILSGKPASPFLPEELLPGWCDPEHENYNEAAVERANQEQTEYDQRVCQHDFAATNRCTKCRLFSPVLAPLDIEPSDTDIPYDLASQIWGDLIALDRALRDSEDQPAIGARIVEIRRHLRQARSPLSLPMSKRLGIGYIYDSLTYTPTITTDMMAALFIAASRVLGPGPLPEAITRLLGDSLDAAGFELFPDDDVQPEEPITAVEDRRHQAGRTMRLREWVREIAVLQILEDVLKDATHGRLKHAILQRLRALR